MLTLTLVIPVYNEEHQIKACLDSISAQTVMPDEVIVVDNNCTDGSMAIAQKYSFVTIIKESSQGRGHARTAGFNAAKSDIIGRIDADSILDKSWVFTVKDRFAGDFNLLGLTGLGRTTFIPKVTFLKTTLFARGYYWFVHASFQTITMWGATMAIRKSAWLSVADKVTDNDSLVHEDQDVSLWIAGMGGKIIQDNKVLITTYGQRYVNALKFLEYKRLFENTRTIHENNGNLSSPDLKRLEYWQLLPGLAVSVLLGFCILLFSLLFLPIDLVKSKKK